MSYGFFDYLRNLITGSVGGRSAGTPAGLQQTIFKATQRTFIFEVREELLFKATQRNFLFSATTRPYINLSASGGGGGKDPPNIEG